MISKQDLDKVLRFDPAVGRFFWLIGGKKRVIGKEAGSFDAHGYGQVNVFGRVFKEHHLAWLHLTGELPAGQMDHINHQRRDNRPGNLRLVTNTENHRNRPLQKNNKTGYVGVSYDRGAYVAKITINGIQKHLGRFKTIEEAAASRKIASGDHEFHENHGQATAIETEYRARLRELLRASA